MKYYEKDTLVKDIHTGAILIIIGSHFRNSVVGIGIKRIIVYRCVEPHEPKHVYMRQHEELMEIS